MIDTSKAEAAVKAAERRKLPVPQTIRDAAGMWQVIVDAGHTETGGRVTAADIPATGEELHRAIVQRAEDRRHAESIRSVAADFQEAVADSYNRLVAASVPGWIASLQPEFDGLVKALTVQAKKLPDDLRVEHLDWNNPKISAAWEKAESAAHQLDQLVSDRKDMARVIGTDGVRDAEFHAVAVLPTPTVDLVMRHVLRDQVGPAMRTWKELSNQPVSRWLHLTRSEHVSLLLARPAEVRDRSAALQRWRDAIAGMGSAGSRNQAVAAVQQALAA